jgi:hypothetical protein
MAVTKAKTLTRVETTEVVIGKEITGELYVLPHYGVKAHNGDPLRFTMTKNDFFSPVPLADVIAKTLTELWPNLPPSWTGRRFTLTIHKD